MADAVHQMATGVASIDAKTLSPTEKIEAVRAEAELKQMALRDTLASNEALQREIDGLHKQVEQAQERVGAARVDLEEEKKRQTLQRYYRRRAEEDQQRRRSAMASLAKTSPQLAQRAAAALHRGGDGQAASVFDAASLEELRVMVADAVDRCEGARARKERLLRALQDIVALRRKLEVATSKQLRHTEHLADRLRTTKRDVKREVAKSAQGNKSLRTLEREVAAARDRCKRLESEAVDTARHAQRLTKRLRETDRNVGALQADRAASRTTAETEAEASERRAAQVEALRRENVGLIQWLLDDSPCFVDDAERERIRVEARLEAERIAAEQRELARRLELPAHRTSAGSRTKCALESRRAADPREERLFNELEDAIRRTRSTLQHVRP